MIRIPISLQSDERPVLEDCVLPKETQQAGSLQGAESYKRSTPWINLIRIPISLPSDERRVLVRAFWLTLSSLLALPWLVAAFWTHQAWPVVVGAAAAALTGLVVVVREDVTWAVYRAWNRRLVRPFASAGSTAVLAICYSVVVLAAKAGTRHGTVTERQQSWVSQRTLPSDAYRALFAGAGADAASGGWVSNYIRWATRTRNLWATSLLPFLAILKLLSEGDEPQGSHANIYTLF
jgi:hypothetical protein